MKIKPFTGTQLCWNWLSGQNGKQDIDSYSGTAVLKQGVVTSTSTEEIWFQPKLKICIQNEAMRYGPRNRAVSLEVAYSVSKICSNQCSKPITNQRLFLWSSHLPAMAGEEEREFLLLCLSVMIPTLWKLQLALQNAIYSTSLFTISVLYSASIHPHYESSPWQEKTHNSSQLFLQES